MMPTWKIVLIAGLVGLFFAICVLAWLAERRDWNRGRCRECGTEWVYFDTDSQGGRGYYCSNRHGIWISWPRVDGLR